MNRLISPFLLVTLGVFVSCARITPRVTGTPDVAVSIPPYVSLVKAIAGDTMTVHSILRGNFCPHTAEATPGQMQMLQNADLFIGVGEGYEKKLLTALNEAKKTVRILRINEKIPLLAYSEDTNHVDPCKDTSPLLKASKDLHFWLGPKSLIIQAEVLIQALSELNPENSKLYHENGAALIKKIKALDTRLEEKLHPYQKKSIIVSHASLGYFCHDYNLIQIAIECEGKNPRPQHISRIYDHVRHSGVICVFTSLQFNDKGTEMVANELNLRIESFDPLAEDVLATIEKIGNDITR
ncbi:MAG: zinc ABC transporter substrate-binding protein [Candidatus Neptunochlamydia sp.]|nr:zinc ABC transporter substrate-binding protein [Candidatus Neptunochlamydia sp.]